MALRVGQILRGPRGTYRLIESLKTSTVFKAQVLPNSSIKADFAVVKTDPEPEKIAWRREYDNYQLPAIASCRYIRTLYDVIGSFNDDAHADKMERDLRTVPSEQFRENSNLPRIIAKSILSALALLKTEFGAIHTDINPNNIFLSGINEPPTVVKMGDLGNMVLEGYDKTRVQSLPTRAPEVWRGLGCWHSSDVWSLGVTLTHWLSPSIVFGANDKIVEGLTEEWCIAKVRRLIGPLDEPVDNPDYKLEFKVAEYLESNTFEHPDTKLVTQFIKAGTLRQELESLPGPKVSPELLEFIEYLFVLDHTKRPTALDALQHPYLAGLP